MQKGYFLVKVLLASLLFSLTLPALAFPDNIDPLPLIMDHVDFEEFKIAPRVSVWGFTGDFTRGEGQILLPIYGNQNRAFFSAFEGNVSANDNDWLAGLGLGYRQVIKDYIVGIYTFADCLNSINSNTFWVANPGIEVLGQKWDFSANGYAPFIHSEGVLIDEVPASDLGILKFASFKGHDRFDHKMQIRTGEEAGRGFDAEIGRVIPYFEQAKLYLGGYHFDSNHGGSTNGVEARLVWELNKYAALEAQNSYDNKNHNAFLVGIRLTLGGFSAKQKETFGISSRLMDPIEHDLVIGTMGNMPSVIPVQRTVDLGKMLVNDNVWFFLPASSSATTSNGLNAVVGNGTFEHPFIDFTPDNFNAINPSIGVLNPNPSLYFAPGNYSFSSFIGRNSVAGRLMLPSGWGMFGRSPDYKLPSKSATFNGGLDIGLDSGSPTILNSIIISQTSVFVGFLGQLLDAENSGTIILKNTDLLSNLTLTTTDVSPFFVFLLDSKLNFEALKGINSVNNISATVNAGADIQSTGILASGAIINFNGINNISLTTTPFGAGTIAEGTGIASDSNSTINFNDGMSNIAVISNTSSGTSTATGIGASDSSLNFGNNANVVIYTEALGGPTFNNAIGIQVGDSSVTFATSGVNKVVINSNTVGNGSLAKGMRVGGVSVINFADTNNTNLVIDVGAAGLSTTRTGIDADTNSFLQRNGITLGALFQLGNFITFIDGGGTLGFKADWPPNPTLDW